MTLKEKIALWFAEREFKKQAVNFLEKVLRRPLTRKEKAAMKNWQTTIVGIIGGITGGTAAGWTKPDGSINWISVVIALVASIFGYVAKDATTTEIGASATKG